MTSSTGFQIFLCAILLVGANTALAGIKTTTNATVKTATLYGTNTSVQVFPCSPGRPGGAPIQWRSSNTVYLAPSGNECIVPPPQPELPADVSALFAGQSGDTFR